MKSKIIHIVSISKDEKVYDEQASFNLVTEIVKFANEQGLAGREFDKIEQTDGLEGISKSTEVTITYKELT